MKKIVKWLENFWYHNRWIVLIVGFFIIAGSIMIFQLFDRDEYDAMLLYTGPEYPNANEVRELEDAFENVVSEDYNGDGKHTVSLNCVFLMTEEQLEDDKYLYDEEGNPIYINTSDMVKTKQQFSTQMFVGEALICLLDPNWYEFAKEQDAFVPLDELLETVPEGSYDEAALYLRDTEFGKYFTAVNALPEDTLICFRRMPTATSLKDKKAEEKRYEYNKQLFIDILEFSIG